MLALTIVDWTIITKHVALVPDGACTLDVQLSHNNTDWYLGPQIIASGAGDIHASLTVGAQYLRVKVDTGSVTITLHADSKG